MFHVFDVSLVLSPRKLFGILESKGHFEKLEKVDTISFLTSIIGKSRKYSTHKIDL